MQKKASSGNQGLENALFAPSECFPKSSSCKLVSNLRRAGFREMVGRATGSECDYKTPTTKNGNWERMVGSSARATLGG
eukprot:IDg15943t1